MLHDEPYGIVLSETTTTNAFATVREDEGMTVIATVEDLKTSGITLDSHWARITLQVHSALSAVGLTASFATALGKHGISANVVAGHHHDHIFVQWDRRHHALSALLELTKK